MKKQNIKYYMRLPYHTILEQWDDGHGPYWVARIAELPHCMIHGETPQEAVAEIEEVKREWIESNLERGIKIPEPFSRKYSGQITLRIPPSLHRLISDRAALEDVSLNQFMTSALAQAASYTQEQPVAKQPKGRASA